MPDNEPKPNERRAVDRYHDPTPNVRELVSAMGQVLKDQQAAGENRLVEMMRMHFTNSDERDAAESKRIDTKFEHVAEIAKLEIKRVDANQENATKNVALANQAAIETASNLATQLSTSNESNRNQNAVQQAEVSKRFTALETTGGVTAGKSGMTTTVIAIMAAIGGTVLAGVIIGAIKFAQAALK